MNERTKRLLGILFLKPAMSSRNLTSIGLVAMFFAVYVMAGGRVSAVPTIGVQNGFNNDVNIQELERTEQEAVKQEKRIAEPLPTVKEEPQKPSRLSLFGGDQAAEEPAVEAAQAPEKEVAAEVPQTDPKASESEEVEIADEGLSAIQQRLHKLGH